jgi:hypothetical protein
MKENQRDCLEVLGYLFLCNHKTEKALVLLEALQALSPSDPHVSRSLCYAYLINRQYEQALSQAERVLRETPEPENKEIAYLFKSRALWGLGKGEEARRVMNSFLDSRESRNVAESS